MKIIRITIFLILILCQQAYSISIVNDTITNITDSTIESKAGYAFGIIPILAYDADLGFKYGINLNVFDYGDGKNFPKYQQYLYMKLMNTTKNTSKVQLLFNSDKLFNKTLVIAEASYINDRNLHFFGFNGVNAVVNSNYTNPSNELYQNEYFYTQERELFRLRFDLQKELFIPELKLYVGLTLNYHKTSSVNHERFSSSNGPNGEPAEQTSLYDKYVEWGIISDYEKSGGNINYLSMGLIYDSRNNQSVSTSGIWAEAYTILSPKTISDQAFSKLILTYRQYFTLPTPKMVFSYRISSQSRLSGTIPYYILPTYFQTKINYDGMGGTYNMRGIMRNRIVANGYLVGNFEVRKKVWSKRILKLDVDFLLSAFTDASYITQEYYFDESNIPTQWYNQLFNNKTQAINGAYGLGLYIIYNTNNVLALNYGFAGSKQLGNGGVYFNSSFLF